MRDDNAVPVSRVLLPISVNLPNYVNVKNKKAQDAAKTAWWQQFDQIKQILTEAAKEALDEEEQLKYTVSG